MKAAPTNAARRHDALGLAYELRAYEVHGAGLGERVSVSAGVRGLQILRASPDHQRVAANGRPRP